MNVIREVNKSLVLLMGFDQPPHFYFLDDGDVMGKYINGTYSRPIILIDPSAIRRVTDCGEESFRTEVLLTIAHELGHAHQDRLGILDETDGIESGAETFAQCWVHSGVYCPDVLQP